MTSSIVRLLFALIFIAFPWRGALGVIVSGDLGSAPEFAAYVGMIGGASGVYLGDLNGDGSSWVITANHVTKDATFTVGGEDYSVIVGSGQQVGSLDLYVFRINVTMGSGLSGLAPMTLSSASPVDGSLLTLMGNGGSDRSDLTYWDEGWNVMTPPPTAAYAGYSYTEAERTLNWGSGASTLLVDGGVHYLSTSFAPVNGAAQGVVGDSGGGMFLWAGDSWELAGLMVSVGKYPGQPSNIVAFGDETYAIDIGMYRDLIINTTIPEPSTIGMVLGGLACLIGVHGGALLRRRRWSMAKE